MFDVNVVNSFYPFVVVMSKNIIKDGTLVSPNFREEQELNSTVSSSLSSMLKLRSFIVSMRQNNDAIIKQITKRNVMFETDDGMFSRKIPSPICFTLKNVLSGEECDRMIELTEAVGFKYV